MGVKWCFNVVLICISLMTNHECLFTCLLAICVSFSEKCRFKSFAQFWLCYLSFYYCVWAFFIYSGYPSLIRYDLQMFLPFCGLSYHYLDSIPWTIKFLILIESNLFGASLVVHLVKNSPATRETWVRSLGWEHPLEKGMAIHSSTLACRIPWTGRPGGLQSMGS